MAESNGKQVFNNTLVSRLVEAKGPLMTLRDVHSVGEAIQYLAQHGITAAPVVDDQNNELAFVSIFDLLAFLAGAQGEAGAEKTVRELVAPESPQVQRYRANNVVKEITEPMSKANHRLVVDLGEGKKLVTQSDVLRHFLEFETHFEDVSKSLETLGLANAANRISTRLNTSDTLTQALKALSENDLNLVPVFNPESGLLETTISVSDFRGASIGDLNKTIAEFRAGHNNKLVVVSIADSLITTIRKALDAGAHHVLVANEQTPIGVVSLSDIVNVLRGIDEDLHSRQLAVYGRSAMKRLAVTNVLISGLSGLGAEIAKNVILAGVRGVTLHDTKVASIADLGSNFYLSEEDVGKNRAFASLKSFRELNPAVKIVASDEPLTTDLCARHSIVVLTEVPTQKAVELNDFCRNHKPNPISFIRVDTLGLLGTMFSDFGDEFVVNDVDGEQPSSYIISEIKEDGKILVVDEEPISFGDDSFVTFTEVEGSVELNGKEFQVKDAKPFAFYLKDPPASLSPYVTGGIVHQVKKDKTLNFVSLGASLNNPRLAEETDFSKFGRASLLHVVYQAIYKFFETNGRLPGVSDEDVVSVLNLTKELNGQSENPAEIDEKVVRQLTHGAAAIINPMAATFGGIAGQEVIKAATGKFHPFFQFLYLDALECLPAEEPSPEDRAPQNTRYDHQILLFGRKFQERIGGAKIFLVGAGALGCEFLKNFSMTGVSSNGGTIFVTDDDVIEKSNLSRQFLFRNWHIHKPKSVCAAEQVKRMNPSINVKTFQERVAPNTEGVFNDAYWNDLDIVINALDNIKARLYVDARCVFFEKPLLESGTLGPKCHSQVVLPHKTAHYGANPDPPEKATPACTLHNFPHNIDHCLQWARSEFVGNFETSPDEINKYYTNPNYFQELKDAGTNPNELSEKVNAIQEGVKDLPTSFEDCVRWARFKFETYFANRILQLTHTFPKDAMTNRGTPFWAPPKRFPVPVFFDANDATHMGFIIAAANLRANVCNIPAPTDSNRNRDPDFFRPILATISVPEFQPTVDESIKRQAEEAEKAAGGASSSSSSSSSSMSDNDLASQIDALPKTLAQMQLHEDKYMDPEEFEKDDDTNFHMDFIAATGNLRARNYGIGEVDGLRAKLIAGRIIPAIATATALATGLVSLELFKFLNDKRTAPDFLTPGDFRNSSNNLALPQIQLFDPEPATVAKDRVEVRIPDPSHPDYQEEENIVVYPSTGFTIWDKLRIDVTKASTLADVVQVFKVDHGLEVDSIALPNGQLLFASFLASTKERLPQNFLRLLEERNVDLEGKNYFLPSVLLRKGFDTAETATIIIRFTDL